MSTVTSKQNVKEFNKNKDVERLFEVYNNALVALEFNFNTFNVENYNLGLKADSVIGWIAYADSVTPYAQAAKAEFVAAMAAYDSTDAYNNSSKKRMKQAAKFATTSEASNGRCNIRSL